MESSDVLTFVKFLLLSFGMTSTFIVSIKDLFLRLNDRNINVDFLLRKPFICSLCMGFYFGMLASYWVYGSGRLVFNGFIASGFCWFMNKKITGDH
mgnify:FL=1